MKMLAIKKSVTLKRMVRVFLALFILMNLVAIFHSYKFTHFADSSIAKTQNPQKLTLAQKVKTLILGINNPRPENKTIPKTTFETIKIESNKTIECWSMKADSSKGTVIIFHGFSANKSKILDKASIFLELGYNTLLVDFMGSGGSEGNLTTVGYLEAEQVKSCFDYLAGKGEKNIFLFGTSMGSVAIMKSLNDYRFSPKGILIECPFGSMYETVCARFKSMGAPTFPMAGLLVFWGGVQNGFWAFGHNPTAYAKSIQCPTLLLYGAKDESVSKEEIDTIFANLKCEKTLRIYPEAGHINYLRLYKEEWTKDVKTFLEKGKS